jgi:tRNA threonylcarbamoyladenosine biosynthesis protein TsaE
MSPASQDSIDADSCCFLPDEAATIACGALLARLCAGRGLITLSGDLGSGKTTLCRALLRALGHEGPVKSPTYTLVEPYDLPQYRVQHYDLYRLADPEELDYLGLRDFVGPETLTLIEWPEKAASALPPIDLALDLRVQEGGRRLCWQGCSPSGHQIAAALSAHFSAKPARVRDAHRTI